jgi:NADH-quinone oxidoreductase subunit A
MSSANNDFILLLKAFFVLRFVLLVIVSILIFVNKTFINKNEKTSSYECGYLPFASRLKPNFSNYLPIRFLFLLFDIEIIFLLPYFLNPTYLHFEAFLHLQCFIFILIRSFWIELKSKIFKKK